MGTTRPGSTGLDVGFTGAGPSSTPPGYGATEGTGLAPSIGSIEDTSASRIRRALGSEDRHVRGLFFASASVTPLYETGPNPKEKANGQRWRRNSSSHSKGKGTSPACSSLHLMDEPETAGIESKRGLCTEQVRDVPTTSSVLTSRIVLGKGPADVQPCPSEPCRGLLQESHQPTIATLPPLAPDCWPCVHKATPFYFAVEQGVGLLALFTSRMWSWRIGLAHGTLERPESHKGTCKELDMTLKAER